MRQEAGASPRQGVESHSSFRRLPAHLDVRLDAGLPRQGDPDPMKTQVTSADPITVLGGHGPHFAELKEWMDHLSEEVRSRREAEDTLREEMRKFTSETKSIGFDDKSVAATTPEVEQVVSLVEGLRRDTVMDVGLLRTEMGHSRNIISSLAEMVVKKKRASKEASQSKLEKDPCRGGLGRVP